MKPDLRTNTFLELIRRASTELPGDVEAALRAGREEEAPGGRAAAVFDTLLDNVRLARAHNQPLCQDTGTPLFFIRAPRGTDFGPLEEAARAAVAEATRRGWLRQNAVDPLTGRPYADNLAPGLPSLHLEQAETDTVSIRLMLKGGGSENMGAQYSLPDETLGAGRDLAGVRLCLLDALVRAQGKGCAPGVLGVCIGGDRSDGLLEAKRHLLRPLPDRSPEPALADLESRLLREAAELGIGPMGFGGKGALLGVKIGTLARLPASFFVSVAYMCWCDRRAGVEAGPDGTVRRWLS